MKELELMCLLDNEVLPREKRHSHLFNHRITMKEAIVYGIYGYHPKELNILTSPDWSCPKCKSSIGDSLSLHTTPIATGVFRRLVRCNHCQTLYFTIIVIGEIKGGDRDNKVLSKKQRKKLDRLAKKSNSIVRKRNQQAIEYMEARGLFASRDATELVLCTDCAHHTILRGEHYCRSMEVELSEEQLDSAETCNLFHPVSNIDIYNE
jgi:hypothetical protein